MCIIYKHEVTLNPNPEFFTIHTHSEYELYYLFDGVGCFVVEGNKYILHPGNLLILRPGEMHRAEIESGKPYERCYFHFPESIIKSIDPLGLLLKPFIDRPLGCINLYASGEIDTKFISSSIQKGEAIISNKDQKDAYLKYFLFPILYEVYKSFSMTGSKIKHDTSRDDLIYEIIQYINKNLYADLSISHIEKLFYISKPSLNQRFKQATDTTIWNYIKTKRLVLANQMLQSGEPATKVAFTCGFKDYSSFYRAFKNKYKISPRQNFKR